MDSGFGMAKNTCKRWCGVTLFASLVIGLIVLLVAYLIIVKLTKSKDNDSKDTTDMGAAASQTEGLEMSEKDVIQTAKASGKKPFIVMVYANWCGHCKNMKPHFRKAAKQFSDKAQFACLDGDKAKQFLKQNNIGGFPIMLKYKNGKKVDELGGGQQPKGIERFVLV